MSGDSYSIQELGGAELARHYPDQGLLPDSNWYNAIVRTEPQVKGFLSWLGSLKHCKNFLAVLSASADGLRILVIADEFTIFIPWSQATVSAKRGWPATIVSLRTAAVPELTLRLHLDDAAADDLFQKVVSALPCRGPPRRMFWWSAFDQTRLPTFSRHASD
jgi:hypothetical protein